MKTIILVVKHRLTVKELIAFPITHQSYPESTEKNLEKPSPPPRKLPPFGPPPLRTFVAFRGEGMDIFFNYTIPIRPGDLDEEPLHGCLFVNFYIFVYLLTLWQKWAIYVSTRQRCDMNQKHNNYSARTGPPWFQILRSHERCVLNSEFEIEDKEWALSMPFCNK